MVAILPLLPAQADDGAPTPGNKKPGLIKRAWRATTAPIRWTGRKCCSLGRKAEDSGANGFFALLGNLGSIASPFVYGAFKR